MHTIERTGKPPTGNGFNGKYLQSRPEKMEKGSTGLQYQIPRVEKWWGDDWFIGLGENIIIAIPFHERCI